MDELQIENYDDQPPEFRPADPVAPAVARAVAALIEEYLPDVHVEHIGSTAVPGLSGKGTVDLLLLYPAGTLESVRNALEALGFQRQRTRDPFPETRPMRTGAVTWAGQRYRLHVHVIAADAEEAEALLSFRDRLRASETLRRDYEACKQAILAAGINEGVAYAQAKAAFFRTPA